MAKVGSLSIYGSLKKQKPLHAIFHIHSLNNKENKKSLELCKTKGILPDSRSPISMINNYIINNNRKMKIITMVRDPIERNISAFFDAFEMFVGVSVENYKGSMQTLETIYHNSFPHEYAVNWFEKQFFEAIHVNIYDLKFPVYKGFLIIKSNHIDVLIIKTNTEDYLKEVLLSEFCNCPNFKLINTNKTKTRLYDEFKNHIKFSKRYLNNQYQSKYALHFFSHQERSIALKRWVK